MPVRLHDSPAHIIRHGRWSAGHDDDVALTVADFSGYNVADVPPLSYPNIDFHTLPMAKIRYA